MMTPNQVRSARNKLKLSARGLAVALGYGDRWGDRTVRKWESGECAVPPDTEQSIKELLAEFDRRLDREAAWRAGIDIRTVVASLGLNARDRDFLVSHCKGESMASIGRRHDVSRERARQILNSVTTDDRTVALLQRYYSPGNRK